MSFRSTRALPLNRPELAVFASGVASMGLEILAGRMVAPQFGSSIYTWGSVIGVFLAALSVGYHYGGKRAADRATTGRLVGLLLWTAAYVAVLVFAGDRLVSATTAVPLPSRFASLPAVVLLFGPPTYLLGVVSPYAAELSATSAVGEASGRVYAVGTIGSIVGAFGTTFVLVPALSVERIGFAFGVLLVGAALVVARPSADTETLGAVAAVTVLLVAAVGSGAVGVSAGGQVVYSTETPYQELEVAEVGDTRTLYLDGQPHSAMDTDDPTRHVFEYTRYFHLPYLFADDPDEIDRVLFVGGGGFTGPKRFVEEYDATVDVVEIDPEVVDVAKRYFAVEEGERLDIHVDDGRRYLRETNHTYDLIVLDAYRKDKVPFHLTTVEFMRLADRRLAPDGMVVANLISAPSGPASAFYRAEYRTMSRVYPQVYSFPTAGGSAVQNVELVATKSSDPVTQAELRQRNRAREIGVDLDEAVGNYRRDVSVGDAPVLRDDRAPVDSLVDPMVGQRYVIQRVPENATTDAPARVTRGSAVGRAGAPGSPARFRARAADR